MLGLRPDPAWLARRPASCAEFFLVLRRAAASVLLELGPEKIDARFAILPATSTGFD